MSDDTGPKSRLHTMRQDSPYVSPWSWRTRAVALLWQVVWSLLFRPTPKPLYRWRLLLLRAFGCRITGVPFVASSVRIKMPWQLTLEDRACIGPGAEVYNLGQVILRSRSVVTQHCYLCGGTHDLADPNLPLVVGDIIIGEDAFIGAKSLILPGVGVGPGAVVGAGSVVTKDVPPWMICAGNPCRPIKPRVLGQRHSSGGEPNEQKVSPDGLGGRASSEAN